MSSLENRIEAVHGLITSESNMKNLSERAYGSLLMEYSSLMLEWKREFEPKRGPKGSAPPRYSKAPVDSDSDDSDDEEISRSVENSVRKVPSS